MAKPIFIIRMQPPVNPSKTQKDIEKEVVNNVKDNLPDYHVLFCFDDNASQPEFECFNHNLTEIQIEELYKKLNLSL